MEKTMENRIFDLLEAGNRRRKKEKEGHNLT